MFGTNGKIAWRQFSRHRLFSFLNLAGLSTGITCVLLIALWVGDEKGMDSFHTKGSRLFAVMQNISGADQGGLTINNTPDQLGEALQKEIPGIEEAVTIKSPDPDDNPKGIISTRQQSLKARELFVTNNFFNVFSFDLLQGNPKHPFNSTNELLISDELAARLFQKNKNFIGQTIHWDRGNGESGSANGDYVVAGIFSAPGPNSSVKFDVLFPHELYVSRNGQQINWFNSNPETYLLLKPETDVAAVNGRIKNFIKQKYGPSPAAQKEAGTLFLQPFTDTYLHNQYVNGAASGGRITYVQLFSLIALFVILIACVNFTNLSTAKATARMKEVGVRKVMGAHRGALIRQFMLESLFMISMSLLLALVLVYLLLPAFRSFTGKALPFHFTPLTALSIFSVVAATTLFAGSYPAFYLSGFNPMTVLKGRWQPGSGESRFRQGLVIFQFTVSVVLIVAVLAVYKQMSLIQSVNLGYNRNNIIRFAADGQLQAKQQSFLTELKKISGVLNASDLEGDMIGNHSGGGGIDWPGKTERIGFDGLYADFGFMETMGIQLKEGRGFSPAFPTDSNGVVFNETAIAAMQLKDPVGKQVKLWGKPCTIIGVVKDFHYESLYRKIGPFFISFRSPGPNVILKMKSGTERQTLSAVESLYRKFNPGFSFDYSFLNSDYQALYASESRVSVLTSYFAAIAILISCLGLFGLAAFTAQRRRKEIGIRKVIGASAGSISLMLSRDFLRLVLLSLCLSLPLSWWLTNAWLNQFAYRITQGISLLLLSAVSAVAIAALTVGTQAWRASRANPVDSLRNE